MFLFCLMFLLAGSTPADAAPARTAEQNGQIPSGDDKPAKQEDQERQEASEALRQIEQYEVTIRDLGTALPAGAPLVAEIVNPFSVRKRGRYYGSIYIYHRNDNFDARNFFDPVGEKLPEFKRNQFGNSLGVFVTDKLTVFGTYDGLRVNRGSTILSHVPTAAMKQGDFGALPFEILDPRTNLPFPGNRIPGARIHPVSTKLLTAYPDPNRPDPDRNFLNNQPSVRDSDTITSRVDYDFSRDSKIFGNYSYSRTGESRTSPLPLLGIRETAKHHDASIEFTRKLGSRLVTHLRLRFNREESLALSNQAGQSGLLASFGISGVAPGDDLDEGYPEFDLAGYQGIGAGRGGNSPRTSFRNGYEFEAGATYVHNNHELQFGGEIAYRQVNNHRSSSLVRGRFEFEGYYTGDAFADFLLGIPATATRGVGSDRADLRRRSWKFYLRHNWKISPKFNLSASLAYNRNPVYRSIRDNVSVFVPAAIEPPGDGRLAVIGSPEAAALGLAGLSPGQAAFTDKNDWEPRLGLAYNPLGNKKLVIRTSYQLSYDPLDVRRALDYLGRNRPFYSIDKAEAGLASPDLDLSNPFESLIPATASVRMIDPRIRNAYVQEWQMTVQNEPWQNWNLEVAYRGRKATRNDRILAANVPRPGPGQIQERRPNPGYGRFDIVSGDGSSIGHTLESSLVKRFSRGFSLAANFSWIRTLSDEYGGDPQNPRDLSAERALAGFSPTRRLSLNYIFDLPVGKGRALSSAWAGKTAWLLEGWRISGITSFQNGRPFNPRMSGDPNNDGVSGDRPDRIGSGILDGSRRSVDQWFAIDDFAAPAAYGFGTSGRNILFMPGERQWDISFIKRTRISEDGDAIELRVQLFNAFNQANFERPNSSFGTSVFGKIFGARESREIEVALKLIF